MTGWTAAELAALLAGLERRLGRQINAVALRSGRVSCPALIEEMRTMRCATDAVRQALAAQREV